MTDLKNFLFELSSLDSAASVNSAAVAAERLLGDFAETKRNGNTVIGKMYGESEYTLLLDAHIDEVSFIVTDVDDDGFLTVQKVGGIDLRLLPAQVVTVHGKEDIPAVFCSTPPHLSKGEPEYDDISKIKLDTLLGARAKEVVSLGDIVTWRCEPACLISNRVTGKAFDDRAAVACLLLLAKRLKGKKLPFNIVFAFSDQEELGMRGARTASFAVDPDEAIALDVSFAAAPDVSSAESGELSKGAMIGISPVLNKGITDKLVSIAKENNIPYQSEVMGGTTGTNADVISITKSGVKTGLISIPLRNMHTSVEVVDLDDVISVCDILEKYILSGGGLNV